MWEIESLDQLLTLLYSAVFGAMLCLLYDILRAVRGAVRHNIVTVFIEDVLFFVFSAFLTFLFLLARTGGEPRGYAAFGMAVGFFAMRFTLSRLFCFALTALLRGIVWLFGVINGKIALLTEGFFRQVRCFLFFLIKNLKKCVKTAKKLLKSCVDMLYTKGANKQTVTEEIGDVR